MDVDPLCRQKWQPHIQCIFKPVEEYPLVFRASHKEYPVVRWLLGHYQSDGPLPKNGIEDGTHKRHSSSLSNI